MNMNKMCAALTFVALVGIAMAALIAALQTPPAEAQPTQEKVFMEADGCTVYQKEISDGTRVFMAVTPIGSNSSCSVSSVRR